VQVGITDKNKQKAISDSYSKRSVVKTHALICEKYVIVAI